MSRWRYVFLLEAELGKSHNLLSINAFKVHDVDFEYRIIVLLALRISLPLILKIGMRLLLADAQECLDTDD